MSEDPSRFMRVKLLDKFLSIFKTYRPDSMANLLKMKNEKLGGSREKYNKNSLHHEMKKSELDDSFRFFFEKKIFCIEPNQQFFIHIGKQTLWSNWQTLGETDNPTQSRS
jgi:hypothetical protein